MPQLLINRNQMGCIGGDLNCIIDKKDTTNHPDGKMSNSLKRVTNIQSKFQEFTVFSLRKYLFDVVFSQGEFNNSQVNIEFTRFVKFL